MTRLKLKFMWLVCDYIFRNSNSMSIELRASSLKEQIKDKLEEVKQ